ncbi:glycosyltransferase family 2 protein [Roseibium sp. SCP14]|uniref:glycosyltransferase family 2 protein n=1 Tax=Roseibium sp. SCP14 TaxID=3141375 RepID=UPI003337B965
MVNDNIHDRLEEAFASAAAHNLSVPADGVIAIILAYNEALRFPYFLEHYRNLGVRHFIVVDNSSTDGTAALLEGQPDVSIVPTAKPYRDYKSVWRQLLCEKYLEDRWVIFPDVDELFVYPGWPDRKIDDLVTYLDTNRYRALFCPMVDMYPEGPLKDLAYRAGESFFDCCPYFDATGYRFNPLKGSHRKRYKTPSRHVFGGTRERLFHQNAKRPKNLLDRAILAGRFSIRARAPESELGRQLDHLLFKFVKNALPDTAAVQSKIPLIKWNSEYKFSGGVHGIDKQIKIAPDWGALLHFKYLDDFKSKVAEAIARKQHTDNAGHYQDYDGQMDILMNQGLHFERSNRFSDISSLFKCGLVREG